MGLGFPFDCVVRSDECCEGLFVSGNFIIEALDLFLPGLPGSNGIRSFQFPVFDRGTVEDARESVVIAFGYRVELVIMASGTTERETEEYTSHGIDLLIDDVGAFLDGVFFSQNLGSDGEEPGG